MHRRLAYSKTSFASHAAQQLFAASRNPQETPLCALLSASPVCPRPAQLSWEIEQRCVYVRRSAMNTLAILTLGVYSSLRFTDII